MTVSLDKATKTASVVLAKKNLTGVQAHIKVAVDISGSMDWLYRRGVVQNVITRLLGIGMNMDVNKAIDVYAFDEMSYHIGQANESNHANFVQDVFLRKVHVGGGTRYADVMAQIADVKVQSVQPANEPKQGLFGRLFGKKKEPEQSWSTFKADYPTLVLFITDGDNSDQGISEAMICQVSSMPIFWQFVGIGDRYFKFLRKLDEMEGRYVDNANFFQVNDIDSISDEELYDRLLNEFPSWLSLVKSKGMI